MPSGQRCAWNGAARRETPLDARRWPAWPPRPWRSAAPQPPAAAAPTSSGPRELTFFVAIQPGGTIEEVSKRCSEGIGRQVHDHAGIPPHRRQPAARTAGPPARRRGPLDRHRRHGRDLDRRVRQRRLGRRVEGAAEEAGDRKGLPQRDRDRLLRGQALRGAVQHQHAAALVPQRPGPEAAHDLGRDDRRGRRAERSRHDPGPGQPLRGLHGLGQRADRERRHARSSPGRKRSSSNRGRPKRRWR